MRIRLFLIMLLVIVYIVISLFPGNSETKDNVVVIVHKSRPKLTDNQIRLIFTGYMTTWPNGGKIRVMINRNDAIKEKFINNYLNMSVAKFNNLWTKKKIRDGVPPPREGSSDVISTLVSSSPKYIGFILESELISSVKVVAR
ncbi:MAG: hypothetical protein SVZ03_14265 [Spirochaetota bacterium]|nr:hypothetical protein [Spirochaetota bacterium]